MVFLSSFPVARSAECQDSLIRMLQGCSHLPSHVLPNGFSADPLLLPVSSSASRINRMSLSVMLGGVVLSSLRTSCEGFSSSLKLFGQSW